MYKLLIDHCYRANTKDLMTIYDQTVKEFMTIDKLKDFLKDRYCRANLKPRLRNKIFIDTVNGDTKTIGMSYSYWSYPYNENSKKVLNTDIITVSKIEYSFITDSEYKEIFKQ